MARAQTQASALSAELARRAAGVVDQLEEDCRLLGALQDEPGQQVHVLFARLYLSTTRRWLSLLQSLDDASYPFLVMLRFYDIYAVVNLPHHIVADAGNMPHWQRYLDYGAGLTNRSGANRLVWLLSLGARAHPRHDLALASWLGYQDYLALFGDRPDLSKARPMVSGAPVGQAFYEAVFDFSYGQSQMQTNPGILLTLKMHRALLRGLRFVWVPMLTFWRKQAWSDALGWIETGTDPFTLPRYRAAAGRLRPVKALIDQLPLIMPGSP